MAEIFEPSESSPPSDSLTAENASQTDAYGDTNFLNPAYSRLTKDAMSEVSPDLVKYIGPIPRAAGWIAGG